MPGISDRAAGNGKLLGQGADALKGITLPNPGSGDETPHNKYADDFTQLNTERVENPDDPQKPGKKHNYKGVVTLVRGTAPNPDSGKAVGGDGQNKVWQLMQGQTGAVAADPSSDEGDDLPGKKHNYVGSVTLIRGTAPRPGGGGVKPGISDQGATGGLISYRTANPTGVGDTTPQNKYADDFKQLHDKLDALKAQVTALQTAIAGSPTTASITALATGLTGATTKIDAITTTLNTVASAGTATQAVVDGLKTDLTALATKVAADNLAVQAQLTAPLNDETDGITALPPKIGNGKPVKDASSPAGLGAGMNGSHGMGPDVGMGHGMNPGMIPPGSSPGVPAMGPMSPVSPMGPGGHP